MTTPGNTDREQSDADQVSNSDKLDQLIAATDTMIVATGELTDSNVKLALAMIEHQERARAATRRFRVTLAALAVILIAVLAAIGYVLGRVDQSVSGSKGARDQIVSCVTPGRPCYDSSQARTAALVSGLVDAIVSNDQKVAARAAACAPAYVTLPLPQRKQAIYECIVKKGN